MSEPLPARPDRPVRAVIFDLDDTLVAFDAVTEPSWKTAVDSFCRGRPGTDPALLRKAIRETSARFWSDPERHRIGRNRLSETRREIVKEAFATLGMTGEEDGLRAAGLADEYTRIRTEAMYLFEGARETLAAVRRMGFKTALLTNGEGSVQREKIERFSLAPYFDGIVIEGEFGRGKPDPAVYLHAARLLGVQPDETLITGDNPEWEIRVPGGLGFTTVFFNTRNLTVDWNGISPDFRIASLQDLVPILEGLCAGCRGD